MDDGQTLVVVVSEVTPDAGCPGYTVTLDNICGGGGSPTPDAYGFAQSCTPGKLPGSITSPELAVVLPLTNTTRIYDIATNTWATGAPIPDRTG